MNKKYEKIEFHPGQTLKSAVEKLLEYKEKGKLVYGEFNDRKLYSDTVTMDSAYNKILGKTKKEHETVLKKYVNDIKKKEEKHIENIPSLTQYWQKQAIGIIDNDKLEYWNEIVPIRLNDLYQGMELKCCLDIIKLLNEDSFQKAKNELYNQGHSGMSYGLVCSMVKEFSKKGKEFLKHISE